jgi:eukaryotic-like serine/threonine-protein kinase
VSLGVIDDSTLPLRGEPGSAAKAGECWGPFRLLESVGRGSFGEVFRAWDPILEREVALKLLTRERTDVHAVLREGRSIARVRHPNVVAVHGVEYHDGRVGLVSDFIKGKTLTVLLAQQGPFSAREAALIGIDICKAVIAVHSARLLHRDIKTSNVMREEGGRILLMDFGLSSEATEESRIQGTPVYMAPELLAGEQATPSSDIYALGVLMFHLVTGRYPVEGADIQQIREGHSARTQLRLMDERPDLPELFASAVDTALDPEPKRRFATAGHMLAALSEAVGVGRSNRHEAPGGSTATWRRFWIWTPMLVFAVGTAVLLGPSFYGGMEPQKNTSRVPAVSKDFYIAGQDLLDHYYRPGNLERSIELFRKAVAQYPEFAIASAGLGRAYWRRYLDTGDASLMEEAKRASAKAIELDEELAPAHVTLGMIYADTGRTDLALQEIRRAIQLDSTSADAYGALADVYGKQGRPKDVQPALQKAIDLAPNHWQWQNQLGVHYLSVGNLNGALAAFNSAVQLSPDNARSWNNLGVSYLRAERFTEAKAAFERAARFEPHHSHFSNLGNVLQLEHRYAEAAAMYEKSISLNSSSYLAWANLASAYLWGSADKSKANNAYRRAISLAEQRRTDKPNDPVLIARLGSYYAAVKDRERSRPLLRRAAALAPGNPAVAYFVGEGYELLGQRDEAIHWITKALELGYSLEYVKRNPELTALRGDSRFPRQATAQPESAPAQ